MASIKKASEQAKQEKANPKPQDKSKTQQKKEERAAKREATKCWTQEPDRQESVKGKKMTLQQYLDIPLHKKWGITIKPASQKQDDKDMALTTHCKGKPSSGRGRFCSGCGYPRGLIRKHQLRVNNETWDKRVQNNTAGHHKVYDGKPTETALKLKALGEDVEKRIAPGQALPKHLQEKLTKTDAPATNPAKAAAKKPVYAKASAKAETKKGKVKQGPISAQKPKRNSFKKPKKEDKQGDLLKPPEPTVTDIPTLEREVMGESVPNPLA